MKYQKYFLTILGVIFLSIAFFDFQKTPAFWFDEGIYYQIVKNWSSMGTLGLVLAPGVYSDLNLISVGYSVFYPAVIAFKIFGSSVFVLRVVAILFMTGFVSLFFLLTRKLFSPKTALFSLILLITFSPLYGNGKSFLGEVPGLFYLLCGLYLATCLEKTNQARYGFFSGLFLGLAMSSKPLYLLIAPACGLTAMIKYKYFLKTPIGRKSLVMAIMGVVLSLSIWALTQFGASSSSSRVISHYANPYYVTDFSPIVFGNLMRFITESTPIHFLILFILCTLYLGFKIKKQEPVHVAELVIFIFAILVTIFYVRTAGWYRYFFPAHVLLIMFFVPGLTTLVGLIRQSQKTLDSIVFLAILGLVGLHLAPLSQEALSSKIDAPTAFGPTLQKLSPDGPILFYSVPQIAALYTGDYYQYLRMSDHLALGQDNISRLKTGFFYTVVIEESMAQINDTVPKCYELIETVRGISVYERKLVTQC